MSTQPCHTRHLLYCLLRPLEPGNDTNRDHKVEGLFLEGQRIDIANVQGKQTVSPRLQRKPMRLLDHSLTGVNGVDAQPALCEGNCHEAGTTANLEHPGVWRKCEVVDPVEHRCLAVPENLAMQATLCVDIDVLPVGRLGLEVSIHFLLL